MTQNITGIEKEQKKNNRQQKNNGMVKLNVKISIITLNEQGLNPTI